MKKLLIALGVIVLVIAATLRLRYGGGEYYPNLSTEPLLPASALETLLEYPEPIGNLAVAADGRVFFTVHPESRPSGHKLLVWQDGAIKPFPDEATQQSHFETILGVVIDQQNRLWTIDHGNHGFGTPRLLAFDIDSGAVVHDHRFSLEVAQKGSFLQDLQIDSTGETIYIADVSFFRKNPALVVYDIASQSAKRVLESHYSVYPQDWIIRNPIKDMVFLGGLLALKPGVDGIAISRDDAWIYYAAMTHDTLYRIPTQALKQALVSGASLADQVQPVGKKPLNDGLSTDIESNVYITDVEHSSVVRQAPDGALQTIIQSPKIRWADALSFGPDGYLYLADSAIPHQMLQSKAFMARQAPYHIFRFKPGIAGIPGQ